MQVANRDVGLRGVNKIPEGRIDECGLGVYVEERRSSAFQAEGKAIGPADSGSGGQLGNVAVAQFAIAGGGVALIGGSDVDASGVVQREFHGVMEGEGFGQQGSGQEEECRQ